MESVYLQLSRYISPAIMIFGTLGALFNEVLFYFRKPLRSTSCALYFRALSANDLLVIWFIVFPQWLSDQFNIDATSQYNWYCKLSQYLTYVFYNLSPYFLVLACFDRLCTSSTNARLRKIATIRIASFLIPTMIVLLLIVYSYVPIWFKLVSYSSYSYCTLIDPTYSKLLAFCLLFLFSIIPPSLMIIFCITTFMLLRQQRHRIMPVNQARLRHRDNQLLKMLFVCVTSNIVCIVPFTVTYFIRINYQSNLSSLIGSLTEIFVLLVDITYATSFYIYTLGTPFYRDECCNLFKNVQKRFHRDQNTNIDLQPRRRITGTED